MGPFWFYESLLDNTVLVDLLLDYTECSRCPFVLKEDSFFIDDYDLVVEWQERSILDLVDSLTIDY